MERGRAAPCLGESQLGFPKPSKPYWTLVGGLEHFWFSPIVGMMIQSDYIICFRGVEATNQILNRRSMMSNVSQIVLVCMPSGCRFSSSATPGNAQCVVYYVNLCATCWGCITLVRGLSNYICAVVSDRCLFPPSKLGSLSHWLNGWTVETDPWPPTKNHPQLKPWLSNEDLFIWRSISSFAESSGDGIADHSLGVSQPARKIYYSICALELALIWFGGDGETLWNIGIIGEKWRKHTY